MSKYLKHLIWSGMCVLVGIGYIRKVKQMKYKIAKYQDGCWDWGSPFIQDKVKVVDTVRKLITAGANKEHLRIVAGEQDGDFVAQLLNLNESLTEQTVPNYGASMTHTGDDKRVMAERGYGGDHDKPYKFTVPLEIKEWAAWFDLQRKYQAGELES